MRGFRRGTVASTNGSEQLGTFDFDAMPAFRVAASPAVTPTSQKSRDIGRAMLLPLPLHGETSLAGAGQEGGAQR